MDDMKQSIFSKNVKAHLSRWDKRSEGKQDDNLFWTLKGYLLQLCLQSDLQREDQSSLLQIPIVHWPTQPLKRKSHHHSYLTTTLGQKPWWGFKSKGDWAWVGLVHAALFALNSYMQLLCLENPAWWCYPQLLAAISFCPTFPWKPLSLGRGACYVSFRATWGEVGTKSHHELRSYWHLTAARK